MQGAGCRVLGVQGCLTHKKTPYPRTLHYAYAYGPMTVLGGRAFSYERGTPVGCRVYDLAEVGVTRGVGPLPSPPCLQGTATGGGQQL